MRPYPIPPRRITEDQGSKGPPLPSSGGDTLDDPLPNRIVKKGLYSDIGAKLIADAKRDAAAEAKEEAEYGASASGSIPESARQFIARHGGLLRELGLGEHADEIEAAVGDSESSSVEESFFPRKRPRMTERRLRNFANSLR